MVDSTNNQSALHIAVAFPLSDETRYRDVLKLLLSHFNKPEQLNAQTGTASKSTPLQMAVAMRNPVAVAALVEAGADIDIQDPAGLNVIGVARSTIVKLLTGLVVPDQGYVLRNGVDIGRLDIADVRKHTAVVAQNFSDAANQGRRVLLFERRE